MKTSTISGNTSICIVLLWNLSVKFNFPTGNIEAIIGFYRLSHNLTFKVLTLEINVCNRI